MKFRKQKMANSRHILLGILTFILAVSSLELAYAFSHGNGLQFSTRNAITAFSPQLKSNKNYFKMSTDDNEPNEPPAKRTSGFKSLFEGFTRELNQDTVIYDETTGQRRLKASSAQIFVLLVGQLTGGYILYQLFKLISAALAGGNASS